MYSDPSLIRENTMRVRLNEAEYALVKAAADKLGMQVSTFCREVALHGIRKEMGRINMTPLS